ncbi:hypothetical protein H6F87_29090 [Cyanobacteria bacterium FACHB-502]|nr:hypothetical protein [Cyanobacteria bacterium FACHB-502]
MMNEIQNIFAKYRLKMRQIDGIATDPDGLTLINCHTADQADAINRERKQLPTGHYLIAVQGMRYVLVAV